MQERFYKNLTKSIEKKATRKTTVNTRPHERVALGQPPRPQDPRRAPTARAEEILGCRWDTKRSWKPPEKWYEILIKSKPIRPVAGSTKVDSKVSLRTRNDASKLLYKKGLHDTAYRKTCENIVKSVHVLMKGSCLARPGTKKTQPTSARVRKYC